MQNLQYLAIPIFSYCERKPWSSGMLCCVDWYTVDDISGVRNTFVFRENQSKVLDWVASPSYTSNR